MGIILRFCLFSLLFSFIRIAIYRSFLLFLSTSSDTPYFQNRYFVAILDSIYVFKPQYPDQTISSEPAGIIELLPSRSGLRGQINASTPQGVNHLIVRDLGNEEILLVACEGGDIIAYTTKAIERAIEQRKAMDGTSSPTYCFPVAFFHEHVGQSAWGLDVHKVSRLIAVSSNTHEIIIFAFAISSEEQPPISDTDEPFEDADHHEYNVFEANIRKARLSSHWSVLTSVNDRLRREKHNFAWNLSGHETNIPTVAFLNDDNSGTEEVYLATTDIDGFTWIWSVWHRKCVPIFTDRKSSTFMLSKSILTVFLAPKEPLAPHFRLGSMPHHYICITRILS